MSRKDFQQLVRQAEGQGWTVGLTRGGHLRWVSPTGAAVFSASTPGDKRALKNATSELRKRGFREATR